MTNMRTGVPSLEVYTTCSEVTGGTSTVPGAVAHRDVESVSAS